MMGAVLPEDVALLSCSQLHGSLLSLTFQDPSLRASWLSAEASAARASMNSVILQEDLWLAPAPGEGLEEAEHEGVGGGGEGGASAAAAGSLGVLDAKFRRTLWLGTLEARLVMLEIVLGAALDVRYGATHSWHAAPSCIHTAEDAARLLCTEHQYTIGPTQTWTGGQYTPRPPEINVCTVIVGVAWPLAGCINASSLDASSPDASSLPQG